MSVFLHKLEKPRYVRVCPPYADRWIIGDIPDASRVEGRGWDQMGRRQGCQALKVSALPSLGDLHLVPLSLALLTKSKRK